MVQSNFSFLIATSINSNLEARRCSQFKIKMSIWRIIFFWIFLYGDIESIALHCDYEVYVNGYACNILDAFVKPNDSVTFSGEHFAGRSARDLKFMAFYGCDIKELPNQIFQSFPNLLDLRVKDMNLLTIKRESFKNATQLKKFYAKGNGIQRLNENTFVEAENLIKVRLHDNAISFVDPNAFTNLTKLDELQLSRNFIYSLHKDTFADLINLKILKLFSNLIETLEEGLFRNNLKLEAIELSINKITMIGSNLFHKLYNLKSVNLYKNTCICSTFGGTGSNISRVRNIKDCTGENFTENKIRLQTIEIEELKQGYALLLKKNEDLVYAANLKAFEVMNLQRKQELMDKDLSATLNSSNKCLESLKDCEKARKKFEDELASRLTSFQELKRKNDQLNKTLEATLNVTNVCDAKSERLEIQNSLESEMDCQMLNLRLSSELELEQESNKELEITNVRLSKTLKETQIVQLVCQKQRVNLEASNRRMKAELKLVALADPPK